MNRAVASGAGAPEILVDHPVSASTAVGGDGAPAVTAAALKTLISVFLSSFIGQADDILVTRFPCWDAGTPMRRGRRPEYVPEH
jgi:hypothetical protein